MGDCETVVAQGLIRRFSSQLTTMSGENDQSSSKKVLEAALCEEIERQHTLAVGLDNFFLGSNSR